jgi:hypothetical protein
MNGNALSPQSSSGLTRPGLSRRSSRLGLLFHHLTNTLGGKQVAASLVSLGSHYRECE